MKTLQLCTLTLASLVACASPATTNSESSSTVGSTASNSSPAELDFAMPPDSNIMKPGTAPTPYSAEEIREGNPPGSWKRYRIVADGRTLFQRFEFVETAKPELAGLAVTMTDESGVKLDANRTEPASWTSLQSHASYEANKTLLGRDHIAIAAGEFDCWTYAVDGREGDISYFWFARNLAGPPVLMERRVDGEPRLRMELVEYGRE